jgi:hypothetical protein
MSATPSPSPLTAKDLVDEYFIENRTKVLEIAAFLDRLDRADPSYAGRDFRMRAFAEALAGLGHKAGRVDHIQHVQSDQRDVPLDALDRKSALGANDRWSEERRS